MCVYMCIYIYMYIYLCTIRKGRRAGGEAALGRGGGLRGGGGLSASPR